MRRTLRPRNAALPAVVLLFTSALAGAAAAQAPPAARENAPRENVAAAEQVGGGLELTVASLQARVRKLESAQPAPDDVTAEALREYNAAIDQLGQAAEWKRRMEALSRLQREAPTRIETTRSEIDAWSRQTPAPIDANLSQAELETQLAEAEAKLSVLRNGLTDVDAELARLAERRLSLPAELAAAGALREGMLGEFALPPLPTGSLETALARRASDLASQKVAAEQAAALELELATQEMRRELLTARRDLSRRKTDAYAARVGELHAALAGRRVKEAEQTAAEARADQASLARVHPVLGELAEENARLAAERTGGEGLTAKIDATARQLSAVGEQLQRLGERSNGVRQKVAAAGLTDAIGLLLRKERADLPHADRTRADIRARRDEISAAQLHVLNLEDMLKALPELGSEVERILSAQPGTIVNGDRARIEASARNLLKTRRTYLDALIRDYNAWFASLVDLDAKENQLVGLVEEYGAFLDQHVLWIPNAAPATATNLVDWRMAAQWIVDPRNYVAAGGRLVATAARSPLATGAGLLLIVLGVVYRRRLKKLHADACEARSALPDSTFPPALVAVLVGMVLALPGPFALWFGGWMLRVAPTAPDEFSRALAAVLSSVWIPVLVAEFLRRATGPRGPASAFLGWPRSALAVLRGQIVLVETVALPAFALSGLLDAQPENGWSDTLGRAAFCFGVGVLGLGVHRVLAPEGSVVRQVLRRADLEWMGPVIARGRWVPAIGAGAIILITVGGYYYTASVLVERLWLSSLVLLAFVVANASTLRWLAAKEAAPPGEAATEPVAVGAPTGDEAGEASAAEAISHVSAQTRSLLRALFGLGLFVALFSVWVDVFPALRFFEKVELWQVTAMVEKTVGAGETARVEMSPTQVPVTVANLLLALLGAVFAIVGARNLPGLLELVLLSRLRLDRGLRYAIATVTRYAVFVAGAVIALENLGVAWSSVQWMVAAVSVGLGFGLQEIFGNFVSGLIVLFERPVRVGDTVTIEGVTGTVSRIEMRATTLIDGDRKELIVPNKALITGKLVNWSRHDPVLRVVVPVRVAHGSDTAAVGRILQEAAKQCATVLETPAPLIALTGIGDNALEFELRVFVADPDLISPTRHELLTAIERKFRGAGVEFPSTQRESQRRAAEAAAQAGEKPKQGVG